MSRAIGRRPKILFFIEGAVPTETEAADAANLGTSMFRNALLVDPTFSSALEECDGVAGKVPKRYADAFPDAPGETSGVGALRSVHAGEPGVSDNQALHLQSPSTGDLIEEDRRRAHRGLSLNEVLSGAMHPTAENPLKPTRPDDSGVEGSTTTTDTTKPAGGWETRSAGIPGAAGIGGSEAAVILTGDRTQAGGDPLGVKSFAEQRSGSTASVAPATVGPDGGPTAGDGLDKLSRAELDAKARERGLNPDEYGNKADVIAAIRKPAE